jgi:hypothetical protein
MNSSSPWVSRPTETRHPAHEAWRQLAARGLRSASATMARLAARLALPAARPAPTEAQLEYHAEAGAPEGALYLDGHLVGWVSGVSRL